MHWLTKKIKKIISGLKIWSLESKRYMGDYEQDRIRSVTASVSVKLRPIETYAPKTLQQLRYTVEVWAELYLLFGMMYIYLYICDTF